MKSQNSSTVRVLLAFLQFSVLGLIAFCENVVTSLTGNINFVSLGAILAELTAAIDLLRATNLAAMDRSRTAIALRNQAWDALLTLMRSVAASVQANCKNNLPILLSSGFLPVKSRTPVGPLGAPETPVLKQGSATGKLDARTKRIRGSYSFCWRLALASDPTVYLVTAISTSCRHTFESLTPGQIYLVEVCGVGAAGEGAFTPAVSLMVI